MKNAHFLFVFCILLFIGGCAKIEVGSTKICSNGGSLVNGICVCINEYTGKYCDIEPLHTPTDNVEGMYRITRVHISWSADHLNDKVDTAYNDTLIVTKLSDRSIATNYSSLNLKYDPSNKDTITNDFRPDIWHSNDTNYLVTFFKYRPDSVYANFYTCAQGRGSGFELHGVKIH